ncbi:phosphotriesterase [Kutzneria buriramensis]|uniref:Phosphotriesterase-related protein n=1 Tax=Kutzneria buriramensis TaxID=1045776 RepID=A0A3E0HF44_9PSEU|nr:phosphotriesterase [Kutzneria buriramensis]REH43817.1 phosphotriesterase-related protein [Kutzneria buriramensis]
MSQVQTVRGPVDSDQLGPTLMHEHIFVLTADVQANFPSEWGDEDERVADAVTKLKALYDTGIRTIVDPTVVGLGRCLPRIRRVAKQVPLNIVAATGIYTYHELPTYFWYRDPDPMADMFIDDVRAGNAGMLKCAIDEPGPTPGVERVMRAIAKAHRETGVPITVHTHPGTKTGWHVKRIMCDEEGVDPARIVLGHSGDTTDADHLSQLADAGFVLGMDRFGLNLGTTFEARAQTLVEMVRRGYAERMVLSHDACCYIDWIQPAARAAALPQWHYTHLHDEVIPWVLAHGITQRQIDTMLVDVPRRFFET